jgi:hypothetical protein
MRPRRGGRALRRRDGLIAETQKQRTCRLFLQAADGGRTRDLKLGKLKALVAFSPQISGFVARRDVPHRNVTADAPRTPKGARLSRSGHARRPPCLIQSTLSPASSSSRVASAHGARILNSSGGNLAPAPTFGCELSTELRPQHIASVEHQSSSCAAWGLGADGAPLHRRRTDRVLPTAGRSLPGTAARDSGGLALPKAAEERTTWNGEREGSQREPACRRVDATGRLAAGAPRRGLAHLRSIPCAHGTVALALLIALPGMAGEI